MADDERKAAARAARKTAVKKLAVDVELLRFFLGLAEDVLHNSANQVTKIQLADDLERDDLERKIESLAAELGDEAQDDEGS